MKDQKEKLKKKTSFTITSQRVRHLKINLPKETKDLNSKNYKTLVKEIEDDANRWKDIPCSLIGESILSK